MRELDDEDKKNDIESSFFGCLIAVLGTVVLCSTVVFSIITIIDLITRYAKITN